MNTKERIVSETAFLLLWLALSLVLSGYALISTCGAYCHFGLLAEMTDVYQHDDSMKLASFRCGCFLAPVLEIGIYISHRSVIQLT